MVDGLNNIAGTSLALGPDHCCTFVDAAQGFAEVTATAYEGDLEVVLPDMVFLVGWGEDF